jgi:hypothetical protein
MKIFKKLLTFLSVAAIVSSMCVASVSAAARTATISVTDSEGNAITSLSAGAEVVVTVTLDSIKGLSAITYNMQFDSDKLAYDVTMQGSGASSNKCPKWMDLAWWNDMRQGNSTLGAYFGKPEYNIKNGNIVAITSYGSDAIEEADEEANAVIGKFHFTAKSDINSDNQITFKLLNDETYMSSTGVPNEKMITTDVTVPAKTVDPEPTVTPWEVTITEEPKYDNGYIWKADTAKGDGNLTKFDVTFTDSESNTLTRSILSSDKSGTFDWNTATTFYVGLKTARTGVTAAWDIAAKDGEKDVPVTLK